MADGTVQSRVGQIEHAKALTTANPNAPEPWVRLGNRLTEAGRLDEAYAAYERALALDPDHPGAHRGLSRLAVHFKQRWEQEQRRRTRGGAAARRRASRRVWMVRLLGMVIVLLVAGVGYYLIAGPRDGERAEGTFGAWALCEQVVQTRLPAGATFDFFGERHVEYEGGGRYSASSTVTLEDGHTMGFTCLVRRTSEGTYAFEELEFAGQPTE